MIVENGIDKTREYYAVTFGSPVGRKVLGDILVNGHFGVTLDHENAAQVAEYNFALVIATIAGVMDSIYTQLGIPSAAHAENWAKEQ